MPNDWLDVSDITPRIAYTATASQTAFAVPFVFFDEASLKVYQNAALLTLAVDYTISGPDDFPTGTVTLLTGATVGDAILIVREVPIEQTAHIPPSGPLDIAALNIQISKLVAILQQLDDQLEFSVRGALTDTTAMARLPAVASRALQYLAFDSLGNPIAASPSSGSTPVSSAMAPVVAAATIALARTLLGIEIAVITQIALTRTALKAIDTTTITSAYLTEVGREGDFVWRAGNYAALVTADPQEGIFVKADAIATSAGAWVRVRKLGEFNVTWFGAVQDTTTDDYTAIQAAINLAGTMSGGDVLITGGAAINTGLTLTVPLVRMVGIGKRYSSLRSTNDGITLVTISAARCAVVDLSLFLSLAPSTTTSLINMASGAVQCTISDLDMVGGSYCFRGQAGSTDVIISDCVMRLAYSGANVYTLGCGAYVFDRCLFNQDWVAGVPAAANDKGARANTTAYVLKDYVTLNGLLLQCSQAGTSGGSAPITAAVWYGTPITDGGVIWYIAGNASGAGAHVDSGSTYITFKDCDFTGSYAYGARVTDGLGTIAPDVTRFNNCTVGGTISHGIHLVACKGVWIDGCEIQANVGNGAGATRAGVMVDTSVTGDIMIRGCRVTSGFSNGFLISNTTFGSVQLSGNQAFGLAVGASVVANVKNFIIQGNNFGSSSLWGNNTIGINIAVGTSDNYIVSANRLFGATTKINDGGTGVNKSVSSSL